MTIGPSIEAELNRLRQQSRKRQLAGDSGLAFNHNDYLGVSDHPRLIEAGVEALKLYGAGSRGSRLLGGNSKFIERVEEKVADFFNAPAALLFSSGYLANSAAVAAVAPFVESIGSDRFNHASLIDGIRLTKKPKFVFEHLKGAGSESVDSKSLVVSETVFSMDGDRLSNEAIKKLLDRAGFCLFDEAHAAGVLGDGGEGAISKESFPWDRGAVTLTFGKAFGVGGAAILCAPWFKEWVVNKARSFIYTTAPPPPVVACIEASLGVVGSEAWRREELQARARSTRTLFSEWELSPVPKAVEGAETIPIIPFLVPGDSRVLRFSEIMRDCGVDIQAIRFPTVAEGSERLRMSLSLRVSEDNTALAVELMKEKWKAFSSQEPIPQ